MSWNIIVLLGGVLPLGVATQRTVGDALIASALVGSADVLLVLGVLALFYELTALLVSIITPVARVVLMIPIAVDTASRIGADGFAGFLAVMLAGSGAFMAPIEYQTNLLVYGPVDTDSRTTSGSASVAAPAGGRRDPQHPVFFGI